MHKDVELLEACDAYANAQSAYDSAEEVGAPGAVLELYARALAALGERIEQLPAKTTDGVEAQLRYLFAVMMESHGARAPALYDQDDDLTGEFAEALAADPRHRLLWSIFRAVNKINRPWAGGEA